MKNLETLTAEEMRKMLKNISEILNAQYHNLTEINSAELQIERIGLEFFDEGPLPETAA